MISVVRRFRCLLHEILSASCESSYCRFSMCEPLWTYLARVDAYICWINYQPNMSFFPRVSWHGLPSAPRFTNHFTCLRITTWPSVFCSQFASLFYPLENKNRCFCSSGLIPTRQIQRKIWKVERCFCSETFCIYLLVGDSGDAVIFILRDFNDEHIPPIWHPEAMVFHLLGTASRIDMGIQCWAAGWSI